MIVIIDFVYDNTGIELELENENKNLSICPQTEDFILLNKSEVYELITKLQELHNEMK